MTAKSNDISTKYVMVLTFVHVVTKTDVFINVISFYTASFVCMHRIVVE